MSMARPLSKSLAMAHACIAKDCDSGSCRPLSTMQPNNHGERIMSEKTCAACDCELDGAAIKVTVGGKTVEVCCEDCAKALNEAYAPTMSLSGSLAPR